jgi:hypothetical protein
VSLSEIIFSAVLSAIRADKTEHPLSLSPDLLSKLSREDLSEEREQVASISQETIVIASHLKLKKFEVCFTP